MGSEMCIRDSVNNTSAELEMTNVDVVGEGEGLVNATNSFVWARKIARELALLETDFSI